MFEFWSVVKAARINSLDDAVLTLPEVGVAEFPEAVPADMKVVAPEYS
jgi:hypothetical protein